MNRKDEMEKWEQLPEEFRNKVVSCLQRELSEKFFNGLRETFNKNPDEWWADSGWHFMQGMSIRNMLRENGFTDKELPSKNWDDYYIQALEVAAGVDER